MIEMLINFRISGSHDDGDGIDPFRLLKRPDYVPQERFTLHHQVLLRDCSTHPTPFTRRWDECDMSNRAGRGLRF
jgi:hypothetical protein